MNTLFASNAFTRFSMIFFHYGSGSGGAGASRARKKAEKHFVSVAVIIIMNNTTHYSPISTTAK
jgi:hypothetical protein